MAGRKMVKDFRKCWRSIGVSMAMAALKSSRVPRPRANIIKLFMAVI